MALCLQEGGVSRQGWYRWLGSLPVLNTLDVATFEEIVNFMRGQHILEEDDGVLWLGVNGETLFGRRHFSDVVTSFTMPMLIDVRHGRTELGQIHPITLKTRSSGPPVFVLAGHAWMVKHTDWSARVCWVEPASETGHSRWQGSTRAAHFELCQAVQRVIVEGLPGKNLSKRGAEAFSKIRENFAWCRPGTTVLVSRSEDTSAWWTFAGSRANAILAAGLYNAGCSVMSSDNFRIRLLAGQSQNLANAIRAFPDIARIRVPPPERLALELKFNECLPKHLADSIVSERQSDANSARKILTMDLNTISEK
jgi:ATP-dependent Lhr-like helicase